MSKRFIVLVFAVSGCLQSGGDPSGDRVETKTSEIAYNGHDYLFVQTTAPWWDAQLVCSRTGQHLVTIGDNLENAFVRDQAAHHGGGEWFIGRSDKASEGFWVWENNEQLRFDNWAPGEPNDVNHTQNCATIDAASGKWNDTNCDMPFRNFICERDSGPPPYTQNFVYSGTNTNSDTQNFSLGFIDNPYGHLVTVGTCGLPGASNTGDTFLRVFYPDNMQEIAANDDACGGLGSNISFVAENTHGNFVIRMGCFGSSSCSGTVMIRVE